MKTKSNALLTVSLASLIAVNGMAIADSAAVTAKQHSTSATSQSYHPYVEVGGTRFFKTKGSKSAFSYDLFMPLWQSADQGKLLFTDVRLYDRAGTPFEGDMHVGYRYLSPEKDYLYGVYTSFDRNRSALGNYFNQITVGVEGWFQKIFLGGNVYMPIGNKAKLINPYENLRNIEVTDKINLAFDGRHEKALSGADIAVGYEFIPGLIGKVGGYYFGASDVDTIYGPRATLAYDWIPNDGKKVLNVFDKFGWEAGVQNDKTRGTVWYLSAKFRIGLSKDSNNHLQGVARHMVDLVHRDVDIVSGSGLTPHTVSMPNKDNKGNEILPQGTKINTDGSLILKSGVVLNKVLFDGLLNLWHEFQKNGSKHGDYATTVGQLVLNVLNNAPAKGEEPQLTCGLNDQKHQAAIDQYRSKHPEVADKPDSYVYGLAVQAGEPSTTSTATAEDESKGGEGETFWKRLLLGIGGLGR